jgi:hypothetical protein
MSRTGEAIVSDFQVIGNSKITTHGLFVTDFRHL